MSIKYPWYTTVNGKQSLLQGDFITSCPVVIPPKVPESGEVSAKIVEYDVVVMSQSCDLEQRKLDLVLLSPVWGLGQFEEKSEFYKGKKGKEALRRGNVVGYHLLNKPDVEGLGIEDYLVVDFRTVYSVPFDFLTDFAGTKDKRLRLLPPYREHLSQAFARFFMRVGLPTDIPSFE